MQKIHNYLTTLLTEKITIIALWYKGKGKVTVLSPHPSSELCSADFDNYLPWSLGLILPIAVWITISTPWGVYSHSHATWRHGLQICPHRYPFPPRSREAMQRELLCSGAQRIVAPAGYQTTGLDLDPNPESCTLPLDQLAAV